jgi:integron integrase
VFTHAEALDVISRLDATHRLAATLMYGAGLRISEVTRLRAKDVDFDSLHLIVRDGKGNKDRVTLLPQSTVERLRTQIEYVDSLHRRDLVDGFGEVYLPDALATKYRSAARSLAWQYVFPSANIGVDPRSGAMRRHHVAPRTLQKAVARAIRQSGIRKHAGSHTFRHSFATRLLEAGYDLRTIQELMGHSDVKTTDYTHVIKAYQRAVVSPIDRVEECQSAYSSV